MTDARRTLAALGAAVVAATSGAAFGQDVPVDSTRSPTPASSDSASASPAPTASAPSSASPPAAATPASAPLAGQPGASASPNAAPPLPRRGDCPEGYHFVFGECLARVRLISADGQRCEPACPMMKMCVAQNTCRPVPRPPLPGPYLHDGFYLRVGLGFGRGTLNGDNGTKEDEWAAPVLEGAIGGSPIPGLAVGIGLYDSYLPSFSYKYDSFLHSVGPFFDVYPRADEGFHIQAAVTFTSLTLRLNEPIPDCTSSPCQQFPFEKVEHHLYGLGLVAGIGIEGWISTQASLGLLLRVQYFSSTLRKNDVVRPDEPVSLVIPAALVAVTYQ